MSGFRLKSGGAVDRDRPVSFSFDGRKVSGFAGDSVASALVASGQMLMGRSFKYHRPRGLWTLGSHEPNALMEKIRGDVIDPNHAASMIPLKQGLNIRSQNRFPSLSVDMMAVNGWLAPLFSAGFYYKTFKWPASFWEPVYEALIRRAAGLGRASAAPDDLRTAHRHTHCDVLVIGGGPAGLSAARAAVEAGASVVICDEHPDWGGAFRWQDWAGSAQFATDKLDHPRIRQLASTTAVSRYDDGQYVLVEQCQHRPDWQSGDVSERLWHVHARTTILASGSVERPFLFEQNDKPGIMSAQAIGGLLETHGVSAGKRVGFCTNNDSVYDIAARLHDAGTFISGILDTRKAATSAQNAMESRGIPVIRGMKPGKATGWRSVSSLSYASNTNEHGGHLDCDCLGVSAGFDPTIHLACHQGEKPVWSATRSAWLMPDQHAENIYICGAARGLCDHEACIVDGALFGQKAAQSLGFVSAEEATATPVALPECTSEFPTEWPSQDGKIFVDFQHDVTASDIRQAMAEGYDHNEQTKRYTTLGMATDQGKNSTANGQALFALASGEVLGESRPITYRPPFSPVSIGALAGHATHAPRPEMRSPLDGWHQRSGAIFEEAGGWHRPIGYPENGEVLSDAALREVRAVRQSAGLTDVSSLGKIDLFGTQALTFFDRMCCSRIAPMSIGQCRYFIMLREDGHVLDDGTVTCVSEDHLFVTTTTAHAGHILAHLEFHAQAVWPELDVVVRDATSQWAAMAIAGPQSRDIVTSVFPGARDTLADLRFMRLHEIEQPDCPIRVMRISFSGELGFELYVHPRFANSLWDALLEAGASNQLKPYGLEALNTLRIEKGFLTGAEISGQTTAWQLRLPVVDKPDFIGKSLANRPGMLVEDRPMLVGLKPRYDSADGPLRPGAHLYIEGFPLEGPSHGYVTSAAYSPTLGHWTGLALMWRGSRITGHPVTVYDPLAGTQNAFDTVLPCQFDPEGERLRG